MGAAEPRLGSARGGRSRPVNAIQPNVHGPPAAERCAPMLVHRGVHWGGRRLRAGDSHDRPGA
eukprot:6511071-Prymnesium_polylepis.1